MKHTQYIDKVIMSCKTVDQVKVAQTWGYNYIDKNINLFNQFPYYYDIERLTKNMIVYLKKLETIR